MPPLAPTPQPIFQALQAFHASAITNAGIQLDVFTPLARGPKAAAQVAQAIKCPERSTAILLDALAAIGLLHKEERKFRLTVETAPFLVKGAPQYIGEVARVFCDPLLWDAMSRFAQAVRHGGTVLHLHAESPNQKFWETFAEATHGLAAPTATYGAGILQQFLAERNSARVLDVACGSGLYGLTVAQECPGTRVTLLDRASVLGPARKLARDMGLGRRVKFLAGDMFESDLGGPYDVVIASHVFHHFSPAVCERLLARFAKVIVPGGRILVHDFIADEERARNVPAAMFAALMLAWTREGTTYTFGEYARMFARAGFNAPVLQAPPQMPTQFLLAERKATRARR